MIKNIVLSQANQIKIQQAAKTVKNKKGMTARSKMMAFITNARQSVRMDLKLRRSQKIKIIALLALLVISIV